MASDSTSDGGHQPNLSASQLREQADILLKLGFVGAAAACIRRLLAQNPEDASAHLGLGCVSEQRRDWQSAVASHRQAVRLRNSWAVAHSRLGYVLSMLGEYDYARAACQEAVRLAPDDALAANNLANCLVALGRWEEAIRLYRRAIELDPTLWFPHDGLARTFLGRGQLEAALREVDVALTLDFDEPLPLILRAEILDALGREEEAAEARKEAEFLAGDPEEYIRWGIASMRLPAGLKAELTRAVEEVIRRRTGGGSAEKGEPDDPQE